MNDAIPFYEKLVGVPCETRWESPDLNLEFAVVGQFVLVAGADEALASVSDIHSIVMVDSLQEFQEFFANNGVQILRGPITNPIGTLLIVKHPDGQVIEYMEPSSN
jgi:predicted enzyme related to lactoylglutathione lyase